MSYEVMEFPPKSWSFSRMNLLKGGCELKYFFQYYGYHPGWLANADLESKQIYQLKNLQSIDGFFGQTFHAAVKDVVKNRKKELLEPNSFRKSINRTIKAAYNESKNSLEDWREHPKWYCMFKEIYYQGDIPQEKKDAIAHKINITSRNVFASKSFLELTEKKDEIIELDELKSFTYKGITAYLKIDALYRIGNKYVIVDWKTSMNESIKDIEQLLFYTWYCKLILGIKLEDIEARLEYVQQDKVEIYQFDEQMLSMIERRLDSDLLLLNKYLINTEINQPLPKERFFKAKGSALCGYCNFKEVC